MIRFLKKTGISLLVISYVVASSVITALPLHAKKRRAIRIRNTSLFSRLALALLGIKIHVRHPERLRKNQGGCLLVANHVSYTDILVIASLVPSVFITSVELQQTLLLGMLARFGGSLFVERRSASGLREEISAIADVLSEGFTVVLFPEGTTSNGERVAPFKNSLFHAACSSEADILPVCLRYTQIDGAPVGKRNRDLVFYYGGVTFFRHFPGLVSVKSVTVEVEPLEPLKAEACFSRKQLGAVAHSAISNAYNRVTDSTTP